MKAMVKFLYVAVFAVLVNGCTLDYLNEYIPDSDQSEPFSFTDGRDGTSYQALKIGDQTWMIENLAYLPEVNLVTDTSSVNPKYYVYDYSGSSVAEAQATANYLDYGVLYNWPAAMIACPDGWHLPDEQEWQTLEVALGMGEGSLDRTDWRGEPDSVGYHMRSVSGWEGGNNGDNRSGFNALPAGSSGEDGRFYNKGAWAWFWTGKEDTGPFPFAWSRGLWFKMQGVYRLSSGHLFGLSVRCVKD